MTKFELHDELTKGLQYQKSTVIWLKSQKTNTETHEYVQLWVNFKATLQVATILVAMAPKILELAT